MCTTSRPANALLLLFLTALWAGCGRSTSPTAPSSSATTAVSIDPNNGKLNGQYDLEFDGSLDGHPVIVVGTFAADGKGMLTGGGMDVTWFDSVYPRTVESSTYSIGSDNRGTMNLNFRIVVGPELFFTFAMSLDQFSPAGVAVRGTLVDAAEPPIQRMTGSGSFVKQGS